MYTNADQLKNKLQEMKTRMSHTMPSIIGITEVKAKNRSMKMKESEFSVDEVGKYDMFVPTSKMRREEDVYCMLARSYRQSKFISTHNSKKMYFQAST